jgi:hypothetical protein
MPVPKQSIYATAIERAASAAGDEALELVLTLEWWPGINPQVLGRVAR